MLATMIDCRIASSVSSCWIFQFDRLWLAHRLHEIVQAERTGIGTGILQSNTINYVLCEIITLVYAIVIIYIMCMLWWEPHKWLHFISSSPCVCVYSPTHQTLQRVCYICVKYYCKQRMVIICCWCHFLGRVSVRASRPSSPWKIIILSTLSSLLAVCLPVGLSAIFIYFSSKQFINAFILLHIYSSFPFRFPTLQLSAEKRDGKHFKWFTFGNKLRLLLLHAIPSPPPPTIAINVAVIIQIKCTMINLSYIIATFYDSDT